MVNLLFNSLKSLNQLRFEGLKDTARPQRGHAVIISFRNRSRNDTVIAQQTIKKIALTLANHLASNPAYESPIAAGTKTFSEQPSYPDLRKHKSP